MTVYQGRFNGNNYSNRRNTHLRSGSSLGQKRNYSTFQEDPEKAVFLSGFRTNIDNNDWKSYREAIYQELQRYYGVYIRKLDLPVNNKFGYLHCKTVEQAESLLALKNYEDKDTGKILSMLDLARNHRNWRSKICVYVYERKTDGSHFEDNSSMNSNYLNVRGRNGRSYNNSASYESPRGDSHRSQSRNYSNNRSNYRNNFSRNDNMCNSSTNVSSRSISPEHDQKHSTSQDSGRNAPFTTPQIDDTAAAATINNLPCNSNKDSALQSHIITEPGSEDELDVNELLKNKSKNASTKTVVAADIDNEQIINYESETEITVSDNENNLNSAEIQRQSSQGANDVDDVINQATNQIVYDCLKQNWLKDFNLLDNSMQQTLMMNYHEAFYTLGKDQAANKLLIEGHVALIYSGILTL